MSKISKVLVTSFISNVFLSLIKIMFGFIGKSSALVADGIHSFSDLSTDIVAFAGNHLSKKPADKKHPFGHGKIEYLTSTFISLVIITVGLVLINGSFNKSIVIPSILTIFVSLVTIIIKFLVANYVHKNGVNLKNNILIASGKESQADVYSSIFVLISILLMQLSNTFIFLQYADIVGTVIVSLFIIKTGYSILRENISILLEEQITDKNYLKKIKNIILEFEEIIEIKKVYILRYGPYYKLLADVIMQKDITLLKAHVTIDLIEKNIKNEDEKIKYVFIHMEPEI